MSSDTWAGVIGRFVGVAVVGGVVYAMLGKGYRGAAKAMRKMLWLHRHKDLEPTGKDSFRLVAKVVGLSVLILVLAAIAVLVAIALVLTMTDEY